MSIFKMFGLGSNNSAEVTRLQEENTLLRSQVTELQDQAPEVMEVEVPVEVEVPAEMVTFVAVQFQAKTTTMTRSQYKDDYAGEMTVSEFIQQVFPSADVERISQISLISSTGAYATYGMSDTLPEEVPAQIAIATTSGAGE